MEEYKKDDRGRSKAQRLTQTDPHSKVDSSTWTPESPENAGVKTGARPLTKRLYKKGGKVIGKDALKRADRKPRKAGGRAENDKAHRYLTPDNLINRDVRMANDEREGVKHIGAFKKGGKAKKRADGGANHQTYETTPKGPYNEAPKGKYVIPDMPKPKAKGGRTHKFGGGMLGNNPVSDQDKAMGKAAGAMKKGGRAKKARGGPEGDFANRNYNADELSQMVNNMSSVNPMGTNYAKVPMPSRRPVDKPMTPRDPVPAGMQGAKKGGKIKHTDEAQDKKLMHKVLKPKAFKSKGGEAHGDDCGCARCHGGRTMKYGGGGVFSGNSKQKVPGATGGRKAREGGGRNVDDMSSADFAREQAMDLAGRNTPTRMGGTPNTGAVAHRAAKPSYPMRGDGTADHGMIDMAQRADPFLYQELRALQNPPTRLGGTPTAAYEPTRASADVAPIFAARDRSEIENRAPVGTADQMGMGDYGKYKQPSLPTGEVAPGIAAPLYNRGGRTAHAKGGKAGKTTINIVMGGHGQQPQNYPNAPVMPPRPPAGVPVPPPATAGGAPMGGGMPPQMPPQMPRAAGGRTGKMVGGSLGNAQGFGQPSMGGYGQMQQPMMGGVGQQGMMPRKSGGRTNYPIDTGAGGGNARLEKIDAYGLKPSKRK